MNFSHTFLISCRHLSFLCVLYFGIVFDFESFSFRSIFIGLLFSHFAMGLYYSKNNIRLMKQKKFALIIASIILFFGIYFSIYVTFLAPYFLIIHTALSDAYLLKMKTTGDNEELLALCRTVFYTACGSILFINMSEIMINILLIIGSLSFILILIYIRNKSTLTLFELPVVALVIYTLINEVTIKIQYLGFYHIMTWYIFSFWMLYIKEQNIGKTISFFSQVAILSFVFILLFNSLLGYDITDQSFLRVIAIWSILHIMTSIPLSKLNPRFVKKLFYVE